jgi:hypothetical protein
MSLRLFSLGMAALALIEKPELKTRLREAKPPAKNAVTGWRLRESKPENGL